MESCEEREQFAGSAGRGNHKQKGEPYTVCAAGRGSNLQEVKRERIIFKKEGTISRKREPVFRKCR